MEEVFVDKKKVRKLQSLIIDWFNQKGDLFPWRSLNNNNTLMTIWKVALGEILLNRVSATRVLPVFEKIIAKYPHPCSLRKNKDEKELEKVLTPLGLQKKKANLIVSVAELFCHYGNDKTKLLIHLANVEGMGKYTYNAVLLFGFEEKVPLVDGVIGRVIGRLFGRKWKGKAVTDKRAWKLSASLIENLDTQDAKRLYYGMLDLGRKICKLRKPNCKECPLKELCIYAES